MEWNVGRRAALVVMSVAFLAGCAQVPRQAFNAQAAAHVKTIVVARAENQIEYPVQIIGHPGMSFGLIGGLVAAADMQVKSGKLTSAIDVKETRVQERFADKLKARLNKAGYETVVVVLPKGTTLDQGLAQAKLKARGDAVVVVELYAGYWAAGPSTDYFPRMVAKVKTFDAKSDKVLYEDSISYGYAMPQAQTVHLASEPAYRFGSIDTLVADPVKTRQGLYVGVDALVEQIANDLRKN
jgi:hypothetical protein